MKMSTEKGTIPKNDGLENVCFPGFKHVFFFGWGIYVKFQGLCAISDWWDFGIIK